MIAGLAHAQTFVVDPAGGPGVAFTTIAAATAAVPDGSVLLVRAGAYAPFTIANKGLTVLGEPGVVVEQAALGLTSTVWINNTAPAQRVTLRGLQIGHPSRIDAMSCAGLVLLDDVGPKPVTGIPFAPPLKLVVSLCEQVIATRCTFVSDGMNPGVRSASSRLVMVDCVASGIIAQALEPIASDVTLVSCALHAGGYSTSRAIFSTSASTLRLLGTTSVSAPGNCIEGDFAVRSAPSVTLSNTPQVTSLTPIADERVTGTGGAVGGSVSATMDGASGSLGVLFLGVPGPAIAPGIPDTWWLDPLASASVAMQLLAGPVTATVPIPPTQALQGLGFGFQALYLTAPAGLSISNPYQFVVQ